MSTLVLKRRKVFFVKEEMAMKSTQLSFTTSRIKAEKFKVVFKMFGIPYHATEYGEYILFLFDNNDDLRAKVDALIGLSFGEEVI